MEEQPKKTDTRDRHLWYAVSGINFNNVSGIFPAFLQIGECRPHASADNWKMPAPFVDFVAIYLQNWQVVAVSCVFLFCFRPLAYLHTTQIPCHGGDQMQKGRKNTFPQQFSKICNLLGKWSSSNMKNRMGGTLLSPWREIQPMPLYRSLLTRII